MKKLIFLPTLLFSCSLAFAQCENYYYLKNNSEIEMSQYDPKGKLNGKIVYAVADAKSEGNGISALIKSSVIDKSGKTISGAEGKFICTGDKFLVNMRMSIPQGENNPYKDMEVKAEDAYLDYPVSMGSGQSLPDGNFSMDIFNGGILFAHVDYSVSNRKVEGKEKISSDAGSWDCFKISSEGFMKTKTFGIGIPVKFKSVEWFAPGFGIVKSESYSKNDKLMGSMLLTAIK